MVFLILVFYTIFSIVFGILEGLFRVFWYSTTHPASPPPVYPKKRCDFVTKSRTSLYFLQQVSITFQDRFDAWVVKRATPLLNSFCSYIDCEQSLFFFARREKRGHASPVSRLQSRAWSSACLGRFARDQEKGETARSLAAILQNKLPVFSARFAVPLEADLSKYSHYREAKSCKLSGLPSSVRSVRYRRWC